MIPATLNPKIQGMHSTVPCGSQGKLKRTNPYVPIFNRMPAKITEPAVGACTCASGNQVCSGNNGTLIAKPANNPQKIQNCAVVDNGCAASRAVILGIENVNFGDLATGAGSTTETKVSACEVAACGAAS